MKKNERLAIACFNSLAKKFQKITTFKLIGGSSSIDFTVINVLHTVHSIAIIQILLFVFCSQSTYYA